MSDEKYEIIKTSAGEGYKTLLNRSYRARKGWKPASPGLVVSFMPGTVLQYKVAAGDRVRKGDVLLLFQAMKMNNLVLAPMDGTVKAIGAEAGKSVPKNEMLVELEQMQV